MSQKQDAGDSISDDGMDAGVCFIDLEKKNLTYAGARISLFYCKGDQCYEIRGDRQSLGYTFSRIDFVVESQTRD